MVVAELVPFHPLLLLETFYSEYERLLFLGQHLEQLLLLHYLEVLVSELLLIPCYGESTVLYVAVILL